MKALLIVCCCVGFAVAAVAFASGGLDAAFGGDAGSKQESATTAQIPSDFLMLYRGAAGAYGLPWQLLAAIGTVECDNGQDQDPACWREGSMNDAGAGGPMQFLASTFDRYGVTVDGSGTPDRWRSADAIYSAANYLRASGAPGDLPDAIYAYNHSWAYVDKVKAYMKLYSK